MNKLIPIEFKNKRVLTTQQLADVYETDTNNINTNFSRNKERFQEGKHYYKLTGNELKEFKMQLTDSSEPSIKFTSQLILWTEKGADRHCKILDTDKAWEQFDVLEDTYFKVREELPSIGLSKELQAIFLLDKRTMEISQKSIEMVNRVSKLENTMTIDYAQQEELNRLAGSVVIKALGGKDTPAYKELSKKVFSQLWKDYKRIVQVNSYKNTAVKDLDFARKLLTDWQPPQEMKYMIQGCNSQMRLG